ncbi:MAG: TolC family protein, partial [bacterium]
MRRILIISYLLIGLLGGFMVGEVQALTLEQSIAIALKQSPVILKKQAELRAAEGQAGQIVANYLPNLSLSGSIGKYYSEPQTVQIAIGGVTQAYSFGIDETADTNSYSASLSQLVFDGGGMFASFGMARKGLEAAKQELQKTANQVTFDVITAYNNVILAQKLVELGEQSVEMADNLLAQANSTQRLGIGTKADVLRAAVQLAKAEMQLTQAKQSVELARNNFNNILGNDLDQVIDLEIINDSLELLTIYDYRELLKIAYENQPAWRQFILAKEAALDEAAIAKGAFFPRVSLVGNYEVGSTKYSSYQSDVKNWSAVAAATWNIFDGTATFNRLKEAEAKAQVKELEEITIRRAVAVEVKNANFKLKS